MLWGVRFKLIHVISGASCRLLMVGSTFDFPRNFVMHQTWQPKTNVSQARSYHALSGAQMMQRNLQNLERLFSKYHARYGTEDDVVKEILETIAARNFQNSSSPQARLHYPRTLNRTGGRLVRNS